MILMKILVKIQIKILMRIIASILIKIPMRRILWKELLRKNVDLSLILISVSPGKPWML